MFVEICRCSFNQVITSTLSTAEQKEGADAEDHTPASTHWHVSVRARFCDVRLVASVSKDNSILNIAEESSKVRRVTVLLFLNLPSSGHGCVVRYSSHALAWSGLASPQQASMLKVASLLTGAHASAFSRASGACFRSAVRPSARVG